jgi:alkylhydroperoxidase/carboxymuconolactone decarboxylase family protein YurZ
MTVRWVAPHLRPLATVLAEAGEVIAHMAFYAGWPNAFSAVPVAKDEFEKRGK